MPDRGVSAQSLAQWDHQRRDPGGVNRQVESLASSAESRPSTRPGRGGRILVVDDEPEILDLLTTHLEDQGYQVWGVATAEEALAWIGRESPDLVLLDVGLPGMPGLEALRRIRRLDPAVGIIVITGSADHALAAATLDAGALDHRRKPLERRVKWLWVVWSRLG